MEFKVIRNDILDMNVDAIVVPANAGLKPGDGITKEIFEKAGEKDLSAACKRYRKAKVGSAVPTLAYALDAKYLLHAVLPKWKNGKRDEGAYLSSAYISALALADQLNCESVAFPLMAAGKQGFDPYLAYEIARNSIESYEPLHSLKEVYLVAYDMEAAAMLRAMDILAEECIDDVHILAKEDRKKASSEHLAKGKAAAQKVLNDGLEKAKVYLDDPENREKILKNGAKIAGIAFDLVISKKLPLKPKKLLKLPGKK